MAVGDPVSDRLHFLKNKPEVPTIDGEPIVYPPYAYQPFPACLYGPWTDVRRRNELLQIARIEQLDLTKPLEREKAEFLIPEWDSREVRNDREKQDWLDQGWAESPADVKGAQTRYLDRIAHAAAERAFDDRRMGDGAKAEMTAAERAAEDHVLDLPAPKRKPGRPPKAHAAA